MKVSAQAAVELKKAIQPFENQKAGINIFTTQGCCGPSIQMDVAMQPGNNQTIVSIGGIDFFIANELMDGLEAVTIEYGEKGFRLEGLPKKSGGCC